MKTSHLIITTTSVDTAGTYNYTLLVDPIENVVLYYEYGYKTRKYLIGEFKYYAKRKGYDFKFDNNPLTTSRFPYPFKKIQELDYHF